MGRRANTGWEATESGWRCGRYAVALLRPGEWALEVSGTQVSSHGRASDAAAQANVAERTRRRRRALVWNVAAIGAALIVMLVAQAGRTVANIAFEPAQEFVTDLEAAYRSVESVGVQIDEAAETKGLVGGTFEASLPFDLGGGPAPPRQYAALVGIHDGECYAVRWIPGGAVFTGVLAADLPCEPHPRLIQPELFIRASSQSPNSDAFVWADVLPPEQFQARWFVPLLLAMVYVVLQSSISLALVFIRPQRRLVPPLAIAAGERPVPRATTPI
jgi:hypothetical protein